MNPRYTRKKKRVYKRQLYIGGSGNNRCVIIDALEGEGLGNTLFILGAGLVAQKKTELPLCIIPPAKNPHTTSDYRNLLQGPNIHILERESAKPRLEVADSILEIANGFATAKWSNKNIKFNASSTKNAKLPARLYQNYLGVKSVIPTVKEILMANEFSKRPVYRKLESETPAGSAFIHVRRGDYVNTGWSLDADYYLRGLDRISEDENIKTVWILSNDLKWCKTIDWKSRTKAEIKFYDSKNELGVLYRMILCNCGAVISPSTFSAWGAMMGADMNLTSTIVYPLNWLTHDNDGDNPLDFPERWVGIPNKVA